MVYIVVLMVPASVRSTRAVPSPTRIAISRYSLSARDTIIKRTLLPTAIDSPTCLCVGELGGVAHGERLGPTEWEFIDCPV